ncbi:hypothetical protein LEP1GSC188_4965 [Leptospira weilii serovar Topaz str. LT2116]|uniref:Uncharacterized protein n=1 Tax=Leptospira weilii serovar Topaz str. LT2116 TaxID=1088540 RepID=M3FMA5_9LEPT|nr:hypothetical protein LEP1GSC188_4965 [Leptospira weilii serovar Topaz str. LT2116]
MWNYYTRSKTSFFWNQKSNRFEAIFLMYRIDFKMEIEQSHTEYSFWKE